jgi:putative phage tail component, N-terminal domain
MYNFTNTNGSQSGTSLPSEALNVNGTWIEYEVPGYQTLGVSGRELSENEISDIQIGSSSGGRFQSARIPSRILTIHYQLVTDSAGEFRNAFNKLNQLLRAEQACLIFHDELDKFFIGTKSSAGQVPQGTNKIISEFDIYCTDPFKYSVNKYVASLVDDTFLINYDGTEKSYPILEVKMNGENGFVGFVNQDGAILQFGNPDEVDREQLEKSQTLIYEAFFTSSDLAGWTLNNATIVRTFSPHVQVGSVAVNPDDDTRLGFLSPSNYGTGEHWHGPSITKKLPPDKNGHVGARNFTLSWVHYFAIYDNSNMGVIQFLLTDKNRKNVASMVFFKNQTTNAGHFDLYAQGKVLRQPSALPHLWTENEVTGRTKGRSSISKFEDELTFKVGSQTYSFVVPEIKDIEVTEVSVYFGQWSNQRQMSANVLRSIRFDTHSVTTWNDIPNKFQNDDVLAIECEKGEVRVNEVVQHGLGALGNDWEKFFLTPGVNQIQCLNSEWANRPNFNLSYRKVWL